MINGLKETLFHSDKGLELITQSFQKEIKNSLLFYSGINRKFTVNTDKKI